MNLYSSQSYEAAAEMKYVASTEMNIKSGQNGRLLISVHQDALTGGYISTKSLTNSFPPCVTVRDVNFALTLLNVEPSKVYNKFVKMKKTQFSTQINSESFDKFFCANAWDNHEKYYSKLVSIIQNVKTLLTKKLFYNCACCLINITAQNIHEKVQHIIAVLQDNGLTNANESDCFHGHGLFSLLLPNDFQYTNHVADDNLVIIKHGVLLTGQLCKSVLGDSQSSVIHIIEKEYSAKIALDFVSDFQFLINHWLLHRGFSVGISDCVLTKHVDIKQAIGRAYLEANLITQTESNLGMREARIANALNTANSIGQKLSKDAVDPENSFKHMIASGSKGSWVNICQITGLLGQQNGDNGRMDETYNGRAFPHAVVREIDFTASLPEQIRQSEELYMYRGFVSRSLYEKLHPMQVFLHAVAGRNGVAATAIQTSSTGYLQRKLIKFLEDLKLTYNSSVTNARENVVQFTYGQNNLDPCKMLMVNKKLQFVNVASLVNKINAQIEWENFQQQNNQTTNQNK